MNDKIFLGRQPIVDRTRSTFGFELFHRDSPGQATLFEDPDDATRAVMERTLMQWGMERIVGDRFGFINASPSLFRRNLHRAMPPEGIIFEICENEPLDDMTMDAIRRARSAGYHFALDNVTSAAQVERSRMLPLVSIVKIDVREAPPIEVPDIIRSVRRLVPDVHIAAEKVETKAMFTQCIDDGFDLFQGFFFGKPEVLQRAARPVTATTAFALESEMQCDVVDIVRVQELVASDPTLAYRILAVVNSSAFGMNRQVDSLDHALSMLGHDQLRHVATLVSMSSSNATCERLVAIGVARARLASRLVSDDRQRSSAFTVGLLSVTDAIYGTPIDELLGDLPVSNEIADALVCGEGTLGKTLAVVRSRERASLTSRVLAGAGRLAGRETDYGESIAWATDLRNRVMAGEPPRVLVPSREPLPSRDRLPSRDPLVAARSSWSTWSPPFDHTVEAAPVDEERLARALTFSNS